MESTVANGRIWLEVSVTCGLFTARILRDFGSWQAALTDWETRSLSDLGIEAREWKIEDGYLEI
ncbi:hypothetical protein JCM15764A_09070 [Geotalea toluenoxydans]